MKILKNAIQRLLGAFGYSLVRQTPSSSRPFERPLVRAIAVSSLNPIELYVKIHHEMFRTGHFDCLYPEWRVRRIRKLIEIYGTDWSGKRIVELGGGLGDIGAFFAAMGADVVSVEGRKENVDFANIKYHHLPTFKSVQRDLEDDFSDLGRFDLVVSFGSLEVIEHIDGYIKSCTLLSNDIAFESFVVDSSDPTMTRLWTGDSPSNDHALYGRVISPSYSYVEEAFAKLGFAAERHNDGLDGGPNVYGPRGGHADGTRFFWRFIRR